MIFSKRNRKWTDFSQPPKFVIAEAIKIIGEELSQYGYKKTKEGLIYKGNLNKSDFKFLFDFKGNRFNRTGNLYKINCHFTAYTRLYIDYFKEFKPFLNDHTIICSRPFGYLTISNSALDSTWDLQQITPKNIVRQIKMFGLESVDRIESKEQIINELCKNGTAKEFEYEVQALKYLMCFGTSEQTKIGLNAILNRRGWNEKYLDDLNKLKRNIDFKRGEKNLVTSLAQLIVDYEKIKSA